jgi:hypothetical protein
MGDIVSLKRVRKQKARDAKDARASQNRAKFGQTKAEKQKTKADAERAARDLDGHKRQE